MNEEEYKKRNTDRLLYVIKLRNEQFALDIINQGDFFLNGYIHENHSNILSTPLTTAARYGMVNICSLLLDKGAQIETRTGNDGTALCQASSHSHIEIMKLFMDRGADIEAFDSCWLIRRPLYYAAGSGTVEAVKLLLDRGADINARSEFFDTALHASIRNNDSTAIIQLLYDHGADLDVISSGVDTALTLAIWTYRFSAIKLLVWLGANPIAESKILTRNSHDLAKSMGNPEIINYLKTALNLKSILCLGLLVDKEETLFTQFLVRGQIYDPRLFLLIANFMFGFENSNKRKL